MFITIWSLGLAMAISQTFAFDFAFRRPSELLPPSGDFGVLQDSLWPLLRRILSQEMPACELTVVYDRGFKDSEALRGLLREPRTRRVVLVGGADDLRRSSWLRHVGCGAYVLLMASPAPLIEFAEDRDASWDFSGRYLVAGPTREELGVLASSRMGRKTQHLVGLLQADGEWAVLANQLYGPEVLRRLTTWRRGSFSVQDPSFFQDKLGNLNGAEVKVVTFRFSPHMMGGPLDRYGRDFEVVRALSSAMNFTLRFVEPPEGELWGKKLANGSWTGLVGALARDNAEMGLANVFLSNNNDRLQVQDFSRPYDSDVSCFLARREPPLDSWHSLLLPFALNTWLAVLAGFLLASAALWALAYVSSTSTSHALLYAWGLHLRVSLSAVPKDPTYRGVLLALWLYSVVLTTSYACNLTAHLTVAASAPSVDTFVELLASSKDVMGIGPFFKFSMASSTNAYLKELTSRYVSLPSFKEAVVSVYDGTAVFIEGRKYLEYLINSQTDSKGTPMRIMKECFAPFSIAVAVQKDSPLKKNMDRVLAQIFDMGLVRKWFLDSIALSRQIRKTKTNEGEDSTNSEERKVTPLTMSHLQGIFIVLIFGLFLSFLVLMAEMICR